MEKIYQINAKEDHNKSLVSHLVVISDENLEKVKEKHTVKEVKLNKQEKKSEK